MDQLISLMRQQLAVIQANHESPLEVASEGRSGLEPRSRERADERAPGQASPAFSDDSRADRRLAAATEGRFTPAVSGVVDAIVKITGYPASFIAPEKTLIDGLGFDSLMVRELIVRLRSVWPELPASDEFAHDFGPDTTVAALAARVSSVIQPNSSQSRHHPDPVEPSTRRVDASTQHTLTAVTLKDDATDISRFPEAVALHERRSEITDNPYFLKHGGIASDTTLVEGRSLVSFSSYNYLGLSEHPTVAGAISRAVEQYGSSVSASRLLSGEREIHGELEDALASLLGVEASVTMVSGHGTNVSVIGHLVGEEDLIVHDSLAHDSIIQGAKLSGATRRSFPHNDEAALDRLLSAVRPNFRRVLIVVEGVYSMDGDLAPVPELITVKQHHGAILMIDEAHSLGTVGQTGGGVGEYFDVDRSAIDLWSGTLSKALSSCGGYVAGKAEVVEYLKYSVPGFVYSVGLTPASAASALASLQIMRSEPERIARLRANSDLFRELAGQAGIDIGASHASPVVPCIVGDSQRTVALANFLFQSGVSVNPILYPAVPEALARLRFFVTAQHSESQIRECVELTKRGLEELTR